MSVNAASRTCLSLVIGVALVVSACGPSTITGEIRDDAIAIPVDHAGVSVRLELRNVGTLPCDLIVGLTTLPADALPVVDGQVVITRDGSPGGVRPQDGGEFPGSVAPGELQAFDLALEGTPRTEDRVIFCNGPGEYEQGRYASLRFDR
jgi:hypothetical protein